MFAAFSGGILVLVSACRPGEDSQPANLSNQPSGGPVVVITGANRGLGLEFARQLHAAGATVIGTARNPEKAKQLRELGVEIIKLDVTLAEDIKNLKSTIGNRHVDMLINNAGIMGGAGEQIDQIKIQRIAQMYDVNVMGPMRVTQALLPALKRGKERRIINISSGLGSIERNGSGGYYGYRESKAALNMFTRTIAGELRDEGFICIAMSPGWVRTDLGGSGADLSPEESITGMLEVFATLTPDSTGGFFRYNGDRVAW